MRFMLGAGKRVIHFEVSVGTWDDGPADKPAEEPPAIFDVSRADTQIKPQWDHDGPAPTARLGFQPNGGAE